MPFYLFPPYSQMWDCHSSAPGKEGIKVWARHPQARPQKKKKTSMRSGHTQSEVHRGVLLGVLCPEINPDLHERPQHAVHLCYDAPLALKNANNIMNMKQLMQHREREEKLYLAIMFI